MNVIIVDDERLARKELNSLLANYSNIKVIAECDNAEDAVEKIDELKPDLVFLDIQMPGKTGFEMLEDLSFYPRIVFVTAYDEYALKAFEVNAYDYVLKPIQIERLDEAIKKIEHAIEAEKSSKSSNQEKLYESDQVFIKDGDKCWFVKLKDIPLFESEGNYVRVYFNNNKPLILKSLNNLTERLDNKTFFRANRKHIINLNWIESVESWFNGGLMVKLKNDAKIEISRRQATKLKDMMSL